MDIKEAYLYLFSDSFVSALLIPVRTETAYPAMIIFEYSYLYSFIVAVFAVLLATIVNFMLGRIMVSVVKIEAKNSVKEKNVFTKFVINKGYILGLLVFFPIIGGFISVVLGYLNIKFGRFLGFVLLGTFLQHYLLISSIS